MSIGSYPSIYAIGHRSIRDIFSSPVVVEEKVDGSQFSFGRYDGELRCRSKGQQLVIDAPEKMFAVAVSVVKGLDLMDGWTYRAEYLRSPKHNTLSYSRIPLNNLALFDVQTGIEEYLPPAGKRMEAARLGIDCVPTIYEGMVSDHKLLMSFLDRDSYLGGCKIEGVVVKNANVFTNEKKIAIGKLVSEAFKEKHGKEWKVSNPGTQDIVRSLIDEFKTEARWRKAIQHLRDDGKLEDSPKDISALIREVPEDILRDSEQDIKDALFAHFWPKVKRGVVAGLPEFYKSELAKGAF